MRALFALFIAVAVLSSGVTVYARDEGKLKPEEWVKAVFEGDACNREFRQSHKNARRRYKGSHVFNLDQLILTAPDLEKDREFLSHFMWNSKSFEGNMDNEWIPSTNFINGRLKSSNEHWYTRASFNAATSRINDDRFKPTVKITISIRRPKIVIQETDARLLFQRALLPARPNFGRVKQEEVGEDIVLILDITNLSLNAHTIEIFKGIVDRLDMI